MNKLINKLLRKLFPEWAKLADMSVEEYNEYITEQRRIKFEAVCNRLNKILPKAYEDYIVRCKVDNSYISDTFYIHPKEYGVSTDDIAMFYLKGEVRIGAYTVKLVKCRHSYDMLSVTKD